MTLCDYEAWIVVDGQEVEHYGIEVDDTSKEVTCWVASTEGKVRESKIFSVDLIYANPSYTRTLPFSQERVTANSIVFFMPTSMAHRLEEGICCSPLFSRGVDQVSYLGRHLCVRTNLDALKSVVSSFHH